MASRGGIYDDKKKKVVKPQYFVKEARHHPNGFTVYKVIRRVPDPHSFDCFKESFIWKRYSDFKDLYKHLTILHRKLFLNGKVPEFAKPKLFGRFEENVVRERQESAENVLNFAVQYPALCKSTAFKEFFLGLRPTDSTSEIRYLKQNPLKPNRKERKELDDSDDIVQEAAKEHLTVEELELFDPYLRTKEFIESTSANQDENWIEQIKQAFPGTTEESQPDDIYEPRQLEPEEEAELLEALKVTVSQDELRSYHRQNTGEENANQPDILTSNKSKPLPSALMRLQMDLDSLYVDAANAREKHRKSSKASAYLEQVIRKNQLESDSGPTSSAGVPTSFNDAEPTFTGFKTVVNNVHDKPITGMPQRNSLLDLPKMFRDENSDDESRGAYLIQASQQISFARAAESKLSYEEAFGHYKAAINTLLQGVQGDTNDARIRAVKRKTAKYLSRAEEIHSNHLKATIHSNDLWKPSPVDAGSSPKQPGIVFPMDVQRTRRDTSSPIPSCPSPRHNSKDLSNYKVLGTVGKVLLVMDTRDSQSYALKILPKSVQNRQRKGVIPTNVPFMVRLHRYYSTENAVCLVIEHAAGGKLWDHLASYFELAKSKKDSNTKKKINENSNISKLVMEGGLSSTPKKSTSAEAAIENDEEEDKDCSSSFLDLCMEYKTEDPVDDEVLQRVKPEEKLDAESQPKSISDVSECPDVDTFGEKPPLYTQSTSSSEQLPIQRSWSYLSWDDGPVIEDLDDIQEDKVADELTRPNFKKISSQGDIKLFTIDPDENIRSDDVIEDSIYDSRSNEGSDSADEFEEKEDFTHELLSEQDLSAFSLLGDTADKTLQHQSLLDQETAGRTSAGSPLLTRVAEASKNSPCLSMNSSFEEEKRRVEGKDSNNTTSALTRVMDENGVSSVDAKTLFRTHSRTRTRSTASVSEIRTIEKLDDDVIEEKDEDFVDGAINDDENNIHSIFVGMDAAKRKSLSYRIPESTIRRWSAEIVVAVGTLHSIAILCRDLNPSNILMTENGHIRLSYFGKWRQVERKACNKFAVKHMYVAPEMCKVNEKKTEACDWWSVGAIIYELMTGKPLHIAHPSGINSHTVLSLPDYLSVEAKSLLNGLLQYYPTQRLGYGIKGLDDLMNHPFFNEIDWDFLIEQLDSS